MSIDERKNEHVNIVKKGKVEYEELSGWFEYVYLIHQALPELDLAEVDTSVTFMNHNFSAPLIIDSMTGGSKETGEINRSLAQLAHELKIGMGVGSQRAAIEDPSLSETYSVVRDVAPDIFVIANIGAVQLRTYDIDKIKTAVNMVKANALAVHLNPLQEAIQPEGEPKFRGIAARIAELSKSIGVPLIVKEVGSGISKETAVLLKLAGVSAINVAGAGGTSWAKIEGIRAKKAKKTQSYALSEVFGEWGIPTAASIIEVRTATDLPLIASGGIRTGLDIAKAIALGADMSAIAGAVIRELLNNGYDKAKSYLSEVIEQYRLALFLTGSRNISELKRKRKILIGPLAEWARQVGYL
ncbi:MAG: type 2 isopentenyl-diphosphate Delta-isomerase [Nitrososphaeria archaeon]